MRSKWWAFPLVLCVGLSLVGCGHESSRLAELQTPTSRPASNPPSDEELISEAMILLDKWGHELSDVASDPASDISRLRSLTTPQAFEGIEQDLVAMRQDQRMFIGYPSYRDLQILQRSEDGDTFQILVCKDISALKAMRSDGEDITSPTRDNVLPTDMTLLRTSEGLKIDRTEGWDGRDPC